MANIDISNLSDVVDKRQGRGAAGANTLAEIANLTSISAMRTRLTALSAAYTAARLDAMTENDMLYAIRVLSADAAGI